MLTYPTYPENLEGLITILGEKGTVKEEEAANDIQLWEFDEAKDYDDEIKPNHLCIWIWSSTLL